MVAEVAVEIWDALTLKLLSTMQSPKTVSRFGNGVAYSPDGHSLAGCSNTAIIIWDTQTGGIVKEIKCKIPYNSELLWSLSGNTIGVVSPGHSKTATMKSYNVAVYNLISGAVVLSEIFQSGSRPYFWAHDKCFQIATTAEHQKGCIINLLEVGTTLTELEQFSLQPCSNFGPFSPITYRISVLTLESQNGEHKLLVLDLHTSNILLQAKGPYQKLSFSPDGNLFAAFAKDNLSIWRYTSSHYTYWRELQQSPIPLQFSPTLSSIFGYGGALLYMLHLDYSPASPTIATTESSIISHSQLLDAFSLHGTYIATVYCQQSTIAITNLSSQSPLPSQFIDTDLKISEMVLTGNVLLVNSPDIIAGWLLTEDGLVSGIGGRRANQNDNVWKITPRSVNSSILSRLQRRQVSEYLEFSVNDEIVAIKYNGHIIHCYHTRTGEVCEPVNELISPRQTWYRLHNPLHQNDCNLYHHSYYVQDETPRHDWSFSQAILQEGWIKDSEGRHRLWLHPDWRSAGNEVDWLDKVTTLRLNNSSELVVIKF